MFSRTPKGRDLGLMRLEGHQGKIPSHMLDNAKPRTNPNQHSMSAQQLQQQQQHQYNRGILPAETLNALDYLVDRLNASSGRLPPPPPATSNDAVGKGKDPSNPSSASPYSPPPIRALLVGTNEGVGLSRSLGTAHTNAQLHRRQLGQPPLQQSADPDALSFSGNMSEEVLSSIETEIHLK